MTLCQPIRVLGLALLCGLAPFWVASAAGEDAAASAAAPAAALPESPDELPIEATARSLQYDRRTGAVIGEGDVVITYGELTLRADRAVVNTETGECTAEGSVELTRGDAVFQGNKLVYNFRTGEVEGGAYSAFQDPWFVRGGRLERESESLWHVQDGAITTCDAPDPHYHLRASQIDIYPGDKLVARNVQFVVGNRAFFWLPVVRRSLDDERSNFEVVPGYSSRFGGYVLTAYNFLIGDHVEAAAHVDYRSKRGFGVGLDLRYRTGPGEGMATGYYADDKEPLDEDDIGEEITSDRYRLRLDHRQDFTDSTYGILTLNKLSDPDVIEDFFEKEFRYQVQPDSRLSVTHFQDFYTITALARPRLNDFYNVVERVPDVSLDFRRMRIAETPLYYDGESSAGWYRRSFADGSEFDDYDSARFDTAHDVSLPTKLGGWLSVVPSLGLRYTYYESGLERREVEVPVETVGDPVIDDEILAVIPDAEEFRTVTVTEQTDSKSRWLISPRLNTFFKAFKVWETENEAWDVHGLRHVVEPSVDYRYRDEPSVTPDQLPQFDNIDLLTGQNFIRLGLRNKLQTKRRDANHNLADLFLGTDLRLDPDEDEEDFTDLIGDLRLRLLDNMWIDMDTRIDTYEPEVREYNTEFRVFGEDDWDVRFSHRYRVTSHNLFQTDLRYAFSDLWAGRVYLRYEADDGVVEEQEYTIFRDLHCWTSAFTVRYRDRRQEEDEIQVWLVMTIKAFPDRSVKLGQ